MSIQVLIVEDSELTRLSLRTTLKQSANLALWDEAEDGHEALALLIGGETKQPGPDVIVMDVGLPGLDGIQTTQKLKQHHPDIPVVMLTSHQAKNEVLEAFQAGASSYALKDTPPETLLDVIEQTAGGATWLDPQIAQVILGQLRPASPEQAAKQFDLTERETDVLKLIAEGKTNQEISNELIISLNTVKTHLKNVFGKLGVDDRTAAALKAVKENLV